jgi:putative membrane protein
VYRPAVIAAALPLILPSAAWADGRRAEPGTWWRAWNGDPLILLILGLLAWLYGRGLARLWAKVGPGSKLRRWQAACYFGSLTMILLALLSPLDALSEELSSVHMVQHMLLTMVAALLFVLGSPTFVLAWGLPEGRQGWGSSFFTFAFRLPQEPCLYQPLFVWILFAGTLWAWHHPALYQAALRDPLMHDAQHLSFFVASCLFWRVCLDPLGGRRLSPPGAVPYLFTTSLHASALGVFLTLSPRVWYEDYATRTISWGLTPLEDQQLAGLIMWMPACLIYPAAAAALFGAWLTSLDGATRKRERNELCPAAGGGQPWTHR